MNTDINYVDYDVNEDSAEYKDKWYSKFKVKEC